MKPKITTTLFFIILILISLVIFTRLSVYESETINEVNLTGSMQAFEVSDEKQKKPKLIKTTERYDDKYFEYLESIKESRDRTFLR